MNTRHLFILVLASCALAVGCQSGEDAQTVRSGDVQAAPAQEVSSSEGPERTTVSGTFSGFDCAVVGELCPTTHRGGDYTTGLFVDDETFYFVVNIPNSFLTQHFRKKAEVEGTVYEPYDHAIEPEVIHVVEDGERRKVYEAGYFIDENGDRATFHEGQFRDGRWVVP